MKVIEAPQWLKDRMEKLKQLPPPTLEKVKLQFNGIEPNIGLLDSFLFRQFYDVEKLGFVKCPYNAFSGSIHILPIFYYVLKVPSINRANNRKRLDILMEWDIILT